MPFKSADIENEYKKNKELRKEDVAILRDWVEKQPHLPKIREIQLILFLHSCFYSIEAAKKTLECFFTVRTHLPEFFSRRDPTTQYIQDLLNVALYFPLPKLTKNNYRIYFVRTMDHDPNNYVFNDNIKAFDMSAMLSLNETGTEEGIIILVDMKNVVFGHMARLSLLGMKKFFFYLQEAMPVRLKGMHFVNIVSFMDKLLAMMKPFMKKELLDVLHLHNDFESLYKFVEPECLPKELGGSLESSEVFHEKMKVWMRDRGEFFQQEEQQVVDETKRPGKPKNIGDIFGVEGTFKKLDID